MWSDRYCIVLVLTLVSSCKDSNTKSIDPWEKEKNTHSIDVTSQTYHEAVRSAQSTMPTFLKPFSDRENNGLDFFVKKAFIQGNMTEHMWIAADSTDGIYIFGTVGNAPIKVSNVKYKDKVSVLIKDIEDYTIYKGDSAILGNFINQTPIK